MTMLEPLGHHDLLLFWLQLLVLFVAARGLGLLAQRFGQPSVIGELAAGLVVGPSLLGRLFPDVAAWLFPGDDVHSGILLAVAWIGVILLLVETGFETDLALLSRMGGSTAMVPLGSLVLPLALGIGTGFVMPDVFVAEGRTIFALFIGVSLAISALPVVAKVLIELRLMRRNVGQVIIAAGMVDDIVGWIMLSTLAGVASAGRFEAGRLGLTVAALVAFIGLAFTLGQRATDSVLRRSLHSRHDGTALPLTAVMLIVLVFSAVTQAIQIEAVFGAFVAGIVIARSRYFHRDVEATIHGFTHALFAPVFFATAGMYVDLGALADPTVALWAAIVLVVASVGKLVGSYIGGRMGPLGHRESIAVGVGLNARGALEIIIATIALSIGVFNQQAYTVIVLLAMTTSMMAPPLLRWALSNISASDEEAERLEREELLAESVIAKARNALLPTRGGANSAMAAHVLDLALREEAHATVLLVQPPDGTPAQDHLAQLVEDVFDERDTALRVQRSDDVPGTILEEASLGYDLLALGLNEDFRGTHRMSDPLQAIISGSPVPILLVRRALGMRHEDDYTTVRFRRLMVPATGTVTGRAAEEFAYTIGDRHDAEVDAVHVLSRTDRFGPEAEPPAVGQLERARSLAERFGRGVSPVLRVGSVASREILAAADDHGTDLVVIGTQLRHHEDGSPFLGHGTEFLLEHARQTVVVVVFPANVTG